MTGIETTALIGLASSAIGAAGTIIGGQAQAKQARNQAIAQKQAADFEAAQLEIEANQELAAAQKEAQQFSREKRLALSRLQAVAAGSGFSATDPTALQLGEEIERQGTLQEQFALFGGRARGQRFNETANARRFSGASALAAGIGTANSIRSGSLFSAAGTLAGGAGSFAGRFGSNANPNFKGRTFDRITGISPTQTLFGR